jgi:hypothetical protein
MTSIHINKRELFDTLNQYTNQKSVLIQKLKEFTDHKLRYPCNGDAGTKCPGFGGSDKKFKSTGNFANQVKNIAHAHLTDNISVTYLVDGDRLQIYGVYTHDEIGTGQPRNDKRQKQVATRWKNLRFDDTFSLDSLTKKKSESEPDRPAGTKPDFTPRSKGAQPEAAPVFPAEVAALAQQIDRHWPQRSLFNKLKNAQDRTAALSIIDQEARYTQGLRDRGTRLHPSQIEYFNGLYTLYNRYKR